MCVIKEFIKELYNEGQRATSLFMYINLKNNVNNKINNKTQENISDTGTWLPHD